MFLKGKTPSGFEFEVKKEATEDFRLLDILSEIDDTNPIASVHAITFLLGKEQKNKLIEFCKDDDGNVPAEKVMNTFAEIMNSCNELKN